MVVETTAYDFIPMFSGWFILGAILLGILFLMWESYVCKRKGVSETILILPVILCFLSALAGFFVWVGSGWTPDRDQFVADIENQTKLEQVVKGDNHKLFHTENGELKSCEWEFLSSKQDALVIDCDGGLDL